MSGSLARGRRPTSSSTHRACSVRNSACAAGDRHIRYDDATSNASRQSMRVVLGTLSLVAALLGAGCASSSGGSSTLTDAVVLDSLSMERGACYGTCEIYQLTLRADGSATLRHQAGE